MKRAASITFLVLCIAVSFCGFYNVLSDNADVRKAAADVACKEKKCGAGGAAMAREERNPFAQSFTYSTGNGQVNVRCMRAAIFVGEYSCAKTD
jgi:hypothetical protein